MTAAQASLLDWTPGAAARVAPPPSLRPYQE
jgi:hypothetical protein